MKKPAKILRLLLMVNIILSVCMIMAKQAIATEIASGENLYLDDGIFDKTKAKSNTLLKFKSAGSNIFEFDKFANPDQFYFPGYFWGWDKPISTSSIQNMLTTLISEKANIVPLPKAKDWRPETNPSTLDPDYLSPAYLELYRYAAGQSQSLGMKMWLYDEGGWPSGTCVHRIVAQNPSLVQKKLTRQILTPANGSTINIPADCLSAFLYQGETKVRRLTPGTSETVDVDNARVMLFTISSDGLLFNGVTKVNTYPDLFNPASTREFIRLTHEEYKKVVGDHFGNTIQITFTDEAQVANPGWTDDIVTSFNARFGYDLLAELPCIFGGDSEHDRQVRIDYFDWWTQRHAEAYYGQIQEWCHANNLLSGGHLMLEETTVNANKYTGHPLRMYRKMDVPGVDVIERQLWPGNNNHHFPKFASTASHQAGNPWSFTESFGVYGSGVTPAQMKWISDYQYVRGINLLVLSRSYVAGNPLWRFMDDYHSYLARLGYLLSLGTPGIRTALYYPVRDIWAGGSDLATICSAHDELAEVLLDNQCDFDLIDDDILESTSATIVNGHLVVGPMSYNVVCVPRNRYMSENAIARLQQFINAGGKVFWVDDAEGGQGLTGINRATLSQLPSLLTPTVGLVSPNSDIRVCKRVFSDGALYFVTNEGSGGTSCTLHFDESQKIFQLDPETGTCWVPSRAVKTAGGWEVPVDLSFAGSSVFLFTNNNLSMVAERSSPDEVLLTITSGWTCRKSTVFSFNSSGGISITNPTEQFVNVALGDWKQVIGNDFSGDVEYQIYFNCTESMKNDAQVLDLGDVRCVSQVWLNGESLGRRLWGPFTFDIKGKIKTGVNTLKVIVTNTLANQYVKYVDTSTDLPADLYRNKNYTYDKEAAANGSGLYGPVTISTGTGTETGIEDTYDNVNLLKVYPVPASQILIVENIPDLSHYNIYNLYGQLQCTGDAGTGGIIISNLKSGVYILRIIENKNIILEEKIIVIH